MVVTKMSPEGDRERNSFSVHEVYIYLKEF